MRILLVEDIQEKAKAVMKFLSKEFPDIEVIRKESYNSSLREIIQNNKKYNLVLLDMTMTTFDVSVEEDGGEPEPIAGCNIIDSMYLRNIKTKVVVVSMYESFDGIRMTELDDELRTLYPNLYMGNVHFAFSKTDWQLELKHFISKI